MKRKRKTKIYVKVVGLKIRLAGKKKIRKVIGHTGNILFWRGAEYVPSALNGGKFAFFLGGGVGLHEISKYLIDGLVAAADPGEGH